MMSKVDRRVKDFFNTIMGKAGSTIGVEKTEKGWIILFEAVDDPGAGFDPILGLYEVAMDEELNVTSYRRKSLRRRSELEWRTPQGEWPFKVPDEEPCMEPTREVHATLVDLLDRVLDKGLVIDADIVISLAGVPLLGISLRAALAGMETMLKYGLMKDLDKQIRMSAQSELPLNRAEDESAALFLLAEKGMR